MSKEDFSRSYDKSRGLCFDENEFLKDSFSVDAFLREHRNKASLEVMRDDLGTHLKTLRLSMIELINKDYEDFVNLSKDLVGLDNRIRKIQTPLELIRTEVAGVKNDLDEAISSFKNSLQQHKEITDKKRSLIHLNQVIICINKLKSILNSYNENQNNCSIELIERAAMEYNHLQFSVSKCDREMNDSQRKEAGEIRNILMSILSKKFLDCLKVKNSIDLVKCLQIYASLDRIQDLESIVRHEVIAPKLTELITEQAIQREPDGIGQVYDEVLNFLEKEHTDLLMVTTNKDTSPPLKSYNFLINSFWPEFEKRISLPILFAPGNPQLFHTRFTKSRNFLKKLELLCGNHSSVLKLRENGQYQHFIQKWNLPVYFKIRFQEIGGQLEKCLSETNIGKPVISDSDSSPYHLKPSFTVLALIKKCWRDDVYLPELSHMFWKLSLQILSRYTVWNGEILNKNNEFHEKRKIELGTLQTSFGLNNYQVQCRLDFLVCLFSDTNKLLEEVGKFLMSCRVQIPNREVVEGELSLSLEESLKSIADTLPKITESIVKVMVSESAVHLRQVSQIPRLFRRTNRKSSAEPCEYVGQVLSFPKQFREWKKDLSSNVSESWYTAVFDELTKQFYAAVHEVLMNAQKTEESLRKLKKKKENIPGKNNSSSSSSGDEEIRQQLVIDVHSFCDGIESFKVPKENLTMLKQLVELVEAARDKSEKH